MTNREGQMKASALAKGLSAAMYTNDPIGPWITRLINTLKAYGMNFPDQQEELQVASLADLESRVRAAQQRVDDAADTLTTTKRLFAVGPAETIEGDPQLETVRSLSQTIARLGGLRLAAAWFGAMRQELDSQIGLTLEAAAEGLSWAAALS